MSQTSDHGMEERFNRPKPRRKIYEGDGYIGGDGEYEKPYSDGLDYSIGGTSLNARPRLNKNEHSPKKFDKEERGKTGLIFKEPLY